ISLRGGSHGDVRPGAWWLGRERCLAATDAKAAQGGARSPCPDTDRYWRAQAPAQPRINLDTHIQDLIGLIDEHDLSDIVLVGHSYGPEKVASLVYLDAFARPKSYHRAGGLAGSAKALGWVRPQTS